jgi:hypothetical protein
MFLQAQRGTEHRVHAEKKNHDTCEMHQEFMDYICQTNIYTNTKYPRVASAYTCPVRRGVSAASFDATGLGVRTGHVCRAEI